MASDEPGSEPSGPFYSRWGPRDGPIVHRNRCPALVVYAAPDSPNVPIGMALPQPAPPSMKGAAEQFELVIHDVKLKGGWVCRDREFIRIVEDV